MEQWYCGKYSKFLDAKETEKHHCFKRQKGMNKGKRCKLLIKQEYFEVG